MFETVGIVGVGLIGGSFALALRKAGFTGKILGVSSPARVETATRLGIVDGGADLATAARECDLLYLAQPILRIIHIIEELGRLELKPGCLVTDAGSTKRQIAAAAQASLPPGSFLGGHPMAGKEVRGPEHADGDLFRGRTYFLVGGDGSAAHQELAAWVEKIGARAIPITAEEHDRIVSITSHLPQLVSTALAATVSQLLPLENARKGAGPGLRDMTRLAAGDWEIWSEIVGTNTDAIEFALKEFEGFIRTIRTQVSGGGLHPSFELGRNFANSLRDGTK